MLAESTKSLFDTVPCDLPGIVQSKERGQELATKQLLEKIAKGWDKRAQVRRGDSHELNIFDEEAADFPIQLIPFSSHPDFCLLDQEVVNTLLSCAWLIYCGKTLDIENHIVTPVCIDIIDKRFTGLQCVLSEQLAGETMVDEAYHVLLTVNACNITKRYRNLNISLPRCALMNCMEDFLHHCPEQWQQDIVKFVTCSVSEIFISDYLSLLSSANDIQPLHQQVVFAHRQDELAHRSVFQKLAKMMYQGLPDVQKDFFASVLLKPVHWFAKTDFSIWKSILNQLNLNQFQYIIDDCREGNDDLDSIDYSGVLQLADDLGIQSHHFDRSNLPLI